LSSLRAKSPPAMRRGTTFAPSNVDFASVDLVISSISYERKAAYITLTTHHVECK
jgi:hypothetical protein